MSSRLWLRAQAVAVHKSPSTINEMGMWTNFPALVQPPMPPKSSANRSSPRCWCGWTKILAPFVWNAKTCVCSPCHEILKSRMWTEDPRGICFNHPSSRCRMTFVPHSLMLAWTWWSSMGSLMWSPMASPVTHAIKTTDPAICCAYWPAGRCRIDQFEPSQLPVTVANEGL